MRFILLALAALSLSTAQAAKTPPGFEYPKWKKLVDLASNFGASTPNPFGIEDRSFRETTPSELESDQQPHRLEIFAATGGKASDNKFYAGSITAVNEDWRKRPNGDWEVEAWLYTVGIGGQLLSASHSLLVETSDSTVKEVKEYPKEDAESPALLQQWADQLEIFYGRYLPKAKPASP